MTTETITAETITDDQIRALRTEAAAAGDNVQVHACDVAIGSQEPIATATAYEDRYGGGGLSKDDRKAILAIASVADAADLCADAINAGQG